MEYTFLTVLVAIISWVLLFKVFVASVPKNACGASKKQSLTDGQRKKLFLCGGFASLAPQKLCCRGINLSVVNQQEHYKVHE